MESNNASIESRNKKVDIRRLPKRTFKLTLRDFIYLSVTVLVLWGVVSSVKQKITYGDEVPLSVAVKDIVNKDYKKLYIKYNLVVLEKDQQVELIPGLTFAKREYANFGLTDFYQLLHNNGVDVKDLNEDFVELPASVSFGEILLLLALGVALVLGFMLVKNMQAGGSRLIDFGQSKARMLFGKKVGITFNDVAGVEDAKQEVVEVVEFLKHPKKFKRAGAHIPRGVLLVGPPGTGKTLLAKAVAGEAGVPFFHTSGAEFEEMLVGAGASRVRDLFKRARAVAPCIIFIDEIDAIAKKRGVVLHGGHTEQTLNQILVEMDGLEDREDIIVMAATNRPDVLDPAILRPGRFDRTVVVNLPTFEARKKILDVHKKGKKFDEGVDWEIIAKKTIGFSGADLENLLNEAAIMAAVDNRLVITQQDLMESYLKVKLGRKKTNESDADELRATALHEAGHAIIAHFTKHAKRVEQVSIISRGITGGVTVMLPDKDTKVTTKEEFLAAIKVSVGGFLAEKIFLGDTSTGVSGDIQHATDTARDMVKSYGMSEKLGFVRYGVRESMSYMGYQYGGSGDYSEYTAKVIDEEVKRIIDSALKYGESLLKKHKEDVEKLADALIEKEEISHDELVALVGEGVA